MKNNIVLAVFFVMLVNTKAVADEHHHNHQYEHHQHYQPYQPYQPYWNRYNDYHRHWWENVCENVFIGHDAYGYPLSQLRCRNVERW